MTSLHIKRFFFVLFIFSINQTLNANQHWVNSLNKKTILRFDYHTINNLLLAAKLESAELYGTKKYKFLVTDDENLKLADFTAISSIDQIDSEMIKESLFIVFFHTDDDYCTQLKKINDGKGIFYSLPYWSGKTRYLWTDKNAVRAIDNAFSFGSKISHQNIDVHEIICLCLNTTKNLPGDYVEIGVYMGGSALTALSYMNYAGINRKSYFLDTFNGMTYQEAQESSDVLWKDTHVLWGVPDTMRHVEGLLQTTNQNFELIESNICRDCLPESIKHIAVCNIDVDLYDATRAALEKVAPLIVKSGIIICEDPTSTPPLAGALLAMEEFWETEMGKKFMKILAGGQYLLIKIEE